MMLRNTILSTILLFTSSTSFALQAITVYNNTDVYGTAKMKYTFCSSHAGKKGILEPHQPLTVEQSILDTFCSFGCTVEIYNSQDCSGASVATVHLDNKHGITSVANHTSAFHFTGSGFNVTVEPGAGLKGWFKKLFG